MTHEQFTFANAKFISDSHEKLAYWIEERMRERLPSFYLLDSVEVYVNRDGQQTVSVTWEDRWDEHDSTTLSWEELTDLDAWNAKIERDKAEKARKADEARAESERKKYEDCRKNALDALGEEAFSCAWEKGRAMTAEQAVGYALKEER